MREEIRLPLGAGGGAAALESAHALHPDRAFDLDASDVKEIPFSDLRALDRYCGLNGTDRLTNVGPELCLFLEKTGFLRRLRVDKAPQNGARRDETAGGSRRISVSGLPVVGEGGRSAVFRLSKDRAVKVFRGEVTAKALEKSLDNLRAAAEVGIPAAIGLEVVQTELGLGTVFEYLDGEILADRMRARFSEFDDLALKFARLSRLLADTRLDTGYTVFTNDFYAGALNRLSGLISDEEIAVYERAVNAAPRRNTAVHGDFHLRNVIVDKNGDFRLIDLDDFGCGHPVWDVASTVMAYRLIPREKADEADVIRFTGLDRAQAQRFFDVFSNEYFAGLPEAETRRRIEASEVYAHVRYARMIGDLYGHEGAEGLSLDALRGAISEIRKRIGEAEDTFSSWV